MTFRPKDKGTRVETAICDYLHAETGAEVLRRTMQGGGNDRGDVQVIGVPLMVEAKATKGCQLNKWGVEVARQCVNASARYGVLIWSPPGLGPKSIERWVAVEWADTALAPFPDHGSLFTGPVSKLAAVMADYGSRFPLYAQAEGVLTVRFRHLHLWVDDLREHIAQQALAR